MLEPLRAAGDRIVREEPTLVLPAAETAADDPHVRAVEPGRLGLRRRALPTARMPVSSPESTGSRSRSSGPGSIEHAHTPQEWVSVDEVRRAVDVYVALARARAEEERNP